MIDINNLHKIITPEMRRTLLQRALYTQPYFYRLSIPVDLNFKTPNNFQSAIGINRDFFLTERQANFGEVRVDSLGFFNVNIYSGYGRSIYGYDSNFLKLHSGFICEEARQQPVFAGSFFDDKQYEPFPFLIRRGDRVYVELVNLTAHATTDTVEVVLKGFNVLDNVNVTPRQTEQFNDSLAQDVEWQYFKLIIDQDGEKSYVIENDNRPRLLLGFGAENSIAETLVIDVDIVDISRRLKLTDTKIPLEFIAPRMPNCLDTHMYYLPTEYYLEPYAKLQFDIKTSAAVAFTPIEIQALTRTV